MKLKVSLMAATAAAVLAACGGGDDPVTTVAATVEEKLATNVSALGATAITPEASEIVGWAATDVIETYDVVAAVGDNWRLLVNKTQKKARVKVSLSDVNAVSDTADRDVDISEADNNQVTIRSSDGKLDVKVDIRTKNITGTIKVETTTPGSTKQSSVAGSGYKAAFGSALAGDYAFAGRTTDVNGQNNSSPSGTFRISADGKTITLCGGSIIGTQNECTIPGEGPAPDDAKIIGSIGSDGKLTTIIGGTESQFGFLRVVPSDLGTALIIDRSGPPTNPEDSGGAKRIGMFAAHKLSALSGNEFDGNWTCSDGLSFTISGTSVKQVGYDGEASLKYNAVGITGTPTLNGVIAAIDEDGPRSTVIPMSSSFAIVVDHDENEEDANDRTNLEICHRI